MKKISKIQILDLCSLPWSTYIFVIDEFHENELPVCSLGVGDILEWTTQLLDGDVLIGHRVICRTVNIHVTIKCLKNINPLITLHYIRSYLEGPK